MFLRPLSHKQKCLFLGLLEKAAMADQLLAEEEKVMLDAYADEMGIELADAEELDTKALCEQLVHLSDPASLQKMTFELIGMALVDLKFAEEERLFLLEVIEAFGISQERAEKMKELVLEYMELYRKINAFMEL